jgi:hypothetical protein
MVRWRGKRLHILALPDYLETEIAAFAELNNRSFNAELSATLHEKYTGQIGAEARLAVLTSLLRSLELDGGTDVINSKTYEIICQVRDRLKGRQGTK